MYFSHPHTFSSPQQPPRVGLSNITTFIELSQLGFQAAASSNTLFLHGGPTVSSYSGYVKQAHTYEAYYGVPTSCIEGQAIV